MIGKCIAVAACRGGDKPWVTKHFDLDIEDGSFGFAVSQARVAAEAALDGLYVIRTSVEASDMTAEQAVLNYKRLAEVERAFRTLKGIDLQVRPIRHRPEGRVKAHIFLSMLAYYVQWHMIQAWAPLTFKDEAGAHVARARDPVAPAKRSQAALAKVHTRTLADGSPAFGFTRLLAHQATIVRNTLPPKGALAGEATFTLITQPNAKQQLALNLLATLKMSDQGQWQGRRAVETSHAQENRRWRVPDPLSPPQTGGRAGVRPDQTSLRLPPVPVAGVAKVRSE